MQMKNFKSIFLILVIICTIFLGACSNNDNKNNTNEQSHLEKETPFEKLQSYIFDNYDSSENNGQNITYTKTMEIITSQNSQSSYTLELTNQAIPTIKVCYIYLTNDTQYANIVYFNLYNYHEFIEFDCFNENYYKDLSFEDYQFFSYKLFPSLYTSNFKIDKFTSTNQETTNDKIDSCSLSIRVLIIKFKDFLETNTKLTLQDFGFTQL